MPTAVCASVLMHSFKQRWQQVEAQIVVLKHTPVKAEVLFPLLYSSKSGKVLALKYSQSKRVKSSSLKNISSTYFCANLTEPCAILM